MWTEDFNQVLAAAGHQKYQKHGGRVRLERVARVLSLLGDRCSMERLFKLVALSVALGNLGLHAKNLSLLHLPYRSMSLAPAYDVVPRAHQPEDGEVALAVGGEHRRAAITFGHLVAEGQAWGLTQATTLAEETLAAALEVASTTTQHERAHDGLVEDIARFITNLLAGHAAGHAPLP